MAWQESLALSVQIDFVAHCKQVEELSMPMTGPTINAFISSILPQLHHLQTLHLPVGHVADFRKCPVAENGSDEPWSPMSDDRLKQHEEK